MSLASSIESHDPPGPDGPSAPFAPELLAPAGDWDALRAAVANGANAVYFGLTDFNARHRAANFAPEELTAVLDFLHEHGVRGYVTFNTLLFSDELSRAAELLAHIARCGADAVIVQDLGLVRLIRALAPELPVHGSTQMTLTERRGIDFVGQLGVERVILARELSLPEIAFIHRETSIPLEVFVHGALCVAYSGQCLTSEAFGGRSANRGQCAQACRQPYELVVDGTPRDLGDKAYLLSPQDLAAFDLIPELTAAGVCSVKIEGRLKSAHYVAAATRAYREALDALAKSQPFTLPRQQQLDLQQSFSRGFTHGFLDGVNHQELVQGRFPKHRGVRIGSVVEVTSTAVRIQLDLAHADSAIAGATAPLPVQPGDGVVFDQGHPEQDEQGGRLFGVALLPVAATVRQKRGAPSSQPAPATIELTFGRGAVNFNAIEPGAIVWKTDDPSMRRRLEETFAHASPHNRLPVDVSLHWGRDGRLAARMVDAEGVAVVYSPDQAFSAARKHPLTIAVVREQFCRLGETPFALRHIRLTSDADSRSVSEPLDSLGASTSTTVAPVEGAVFVELRLPEAATSRPEPTGPSCDELPVMVPKSVLNQIRRELVTRLITRRHALHRSRTFDPQALPRLRAEATARRTTLASSNAHTSARLSVLVRNVDQLRSVLAWSQSSANAPEVTVLGDQTRLLDRVYCDFEDVRQYREAVALGRAVGVPIGLATPRILKPREEGLLRQVLAADPDAVLVRNLAGLRFFRETAPALPLVADYSLNVANDLTTALFLEQGVERVVPSYDLTISQLESLVRQCDPLWFEVVLHQHMPMFHMEHCVFSHVLSNGRDHHDCGRPCDRHRVELRDHVGVAHPLVADVGCRNTLFQAEAQSAASFYPRLASLGLRSFRIEFLHESLAEVETLLDLYRRVLAGEHTSSGTWKSLKVLEQYGVTQGQLGQNS